MKRTTASIMTAAALMLLSVPSFAASTVFTENQLLGSHVMTQDGKEVGDIQSINLDSKTGAIQSITLKERADEHYGLAPTWGSLGTRGAMINPMFQDQERNVGE